VRCCDAASMTSSTQQWQVLVGYLRQLAACFVLTRQLLLPVCAFVLQDVCVAEAA
jgi:hypothetical protein